jgi:type II secretory ATPase GspE/PulE/Tfp pilus assembly ATPase PilB-like protein
VDLTAMTLIDKEVALQHLMLPLADAPGKSVGESPLHSSVLRLAVADPWNIEAIDFVQRLTKRRVEPVLANVTALQLAIERAYQDSGNDNQKLVAATLEQTGEMGYDVTDERSASELIKESDQAPVIRLMNQILSDAARRRASDIHVEPYEKNFDIRFRIDGELHVIQTLPRALLATLVSRIKIMADLDITERRLPQDGRISTTLENRRLDFRISTLPVQFGERVVFRILDRASASLTMDQLSFSERNRAAFEGMIRHPHGIILVTGPTGSGKTTTLYATLNALKSPTTNILTCEDPIEYQLDRIGQSAVNEKAGLTFASQLRALMRQDPDIILVGEIRDAETAETAFRAALTGHLVFSTLHCNEAAGAPTRLLDMGVPGFLISSGLLGVIAQRLVRRLCPHCRREFTPGRELTARIEAMSGMPFEGGSLCEPVGCRQCDNIGLRGRMGAHEVMVMNDQLRALCMKDSDTAAVRQVARESGMVPLVRDGLEKARQGLTTFEEVQRKLIAA